MKYLGLCLGLGLWLTMYYIIIINNLYRYPLVITVYIILCLVFGWMAGGVDK